MLRSSRSSILSLPLFLVACAHEGGGAGMPDGGPTRDASTAPTRDGGGMDARVAMSDAAPGDAALDTSSRDAEPVDATPDTGTRCPAFVVPDDCAPASDGLLPSELRCTGLYAGATLSELACDVRAYEPAYTLWSDGTEKRRYVWLPPATQVDVTNPDAFQFPVGTKFWKEFQTPSGTKLETRLLEKREVGWLYTTYVWSADGSAALQTNQGVDDVFGTGHQVPTRDQCAECHAGRPDFVLGWDHLLLGEGASGLTAQTLAHEGLLRSTATQDGLPSPAHLALAIPGDTLERAALGILHVNCGVSCHNASPSARAQDTGLWLNLRARDLGSVQDTQAVVTGVNKLPSPHAAQPAGGPFLVIRPGHPQHSLLVARMGLRGEGQMPPIATSRVDEAASEAVASWIANMSVDGGYAAPADLPDAGPGEPADAGVFVDAGANADAGIAVDAGLDAGSEDGGVSCEPLSAPVLPALAVRTVVRDASLSTLSFAAQAPGSDDWYLAEMRGRIMVVRDGVLQPTPFLDLSSAIELGAGYDQTTITYDERGLVGLAFAPDYATSGLFYVAITPSRSNELGLPVNHDMVIEYRRPSTPSESPTRTRILVEVGSANTFLGNIHNANTVLFGPDGMLYVGMGDGGGVSCNNAELNSAQDVGSMFGKILRLDPSRPAPHAALGNPFATTGDPRVLHYGLRNPFRFSFDRGTGDLFVGDVGQTRFEEIDVAPAGAQGLNFGWATYEALSHCMTPPRPFAPGASHSEPAFVAVRGGSGPFSDYRAIVGGRVYRGQALPELRGVYLFGDYYGQRLGALTRCGGAVSPVATLRKNCDPNFPEPCLTRPAGEPAISSLTAIVESHEGELFMVANGDTLLEVVRASP